MQVNISNEILHSIISQADKYKLLVSRVPCYIQPDESAVKILTVASSAICSNSERGFFIKATIESQKVILKFKSKKVDCN